VVDQTPLPCDHQSWELLGDGTMYVSHNCDGVDTLGLAVVTLVSSSPVLDPSAASNGTAGTADHTGHTGHTANSTTSTTSKNAADGSGTTDNANTERGAAGVRASAGVNEHVVAGAGAHAGARAGGALPKRAVVVRGTDHLTAGITDHGPW
jgi:hypothetical protein